MNLFVEERGFQPPAAEHGRVILGRSWMFLWTLVAVVVLSVHLAHRMPFPWAAIKDPFLKLRIFALPAFATHWALVLLGSFATCAIMATSWSLGGGLLRWIGIRSGLSSGERACINVLTGIALGATISLGLGLSGLFYKPLLTFVFVGIAVILCPFGGKGITFQQSLRFDGAELLLAGLAIVGFILIMPAGLAPLTACDTFANGIAGPLLWSGMHKVSWTIRYHLLLPNLQEYFYGVAWSISPRGVHLAEVCTWLGLVYFWVAGRWGRTAGLLSVVGLLAGTQTASTVAQVKHEILAASYALSAVVLWRANAVLQSRMGLMCGALLGWALCTKYPACAIGVGIVFWELRDTARRGSSASMRPVGLLVVGGLLAFAPFALKNWILTGNPLFPFVWGGLGWPDYLVTALVADAGCPGRDILLHKPETLFKAARILLFDHAPLVWLSLPLFVPAWQKRSRGLRPLIIASFFGFVVLVAFAPCLRLMVPITAVLTVCGAVALSDSEMLKGKTRVAGVFLVSVGILLGVFRALAAGDLEGLRNRFRIASGLGIEPAEVYLTRCLTTVLAAARRLERDPPAKLLLIGEPKGALFSRRSLALSQDVIDLPLMLTITQESHTAERMAIRFKQFGVTMVVLNYVGSQWAGAISAGVLMWRTDELKRAREFWARWGEWLPPQDPYDFAEGGFAFYKIRRTPGVAPNVLPFVPGTEGLVEWLYNENRDGRRRRLEALVAAVPGVGHFESTLGCVLVECGEYEEAIRWLQRGMRSGFQDSGMHGCMGLALRELHRYREAANSFRKAAELRPEEPKFRRDCEECMKMDGKR